MTTKAIEGYFLSFTKEEWADVSGMLLDEGFEDNGAGLKKFIVQCSLEKDEPPHATLTPEMIGYYARAAQATVNKIRTALKR